MSTRKNPPAVPPTPTPSKTIPLPRGTLSTGARATLADYTAERAAKLRHEQPSGGVDSPLSGTREDARAAAAFSKNLEGTRLFGRFAAVRKEKKTEGEDKQEEEKHAEKKTDTAAGDDGEVGQPMRGKH